jgi:lipid-A-disaccharide synthase
LTKELSDILFNPGRRKEIEKDYATLKQLLAQGGNASANAARSITRFLNGEA